MTLYLGTSPVANTGYNKANTDLSNLASTGKNIANWSSNVTNCITEIPQDIKLELNNGTLTLKAGSKVYVPNGVGVFNEVTITSDMQITPTGYASSPHMLCVLPNNTIQLLSLDNQQYSGSTPPSGQRYMFWYDTANNYVKYTTDSGSTWQSGWCLPLAIVTITNGTGVTSIDQVFNGFGYIGSTVFALPGVKGLIPNGRNADGTLKNTDFTVDSVKIATRTWNISFNQTIAWFPGGYGDNIWFYRDFVVSTTQPSYVDYTLWYNPETNITKYNDLDIDTGWIEVQAIPLFVCGFDGTSKINGIYNVKQVFHALDWSDFASLPNYNPSTTQTLKHVNGVLQWG